jgi:hypothetical protein
MTGADRKGADKPWPPLIVGAHVPPLVKWRDALLTSIAWICFVILIDTEVILFFGNLLQLLGFDRYDAVADRPMYIKRLAPFLLTSAGLIAVLFMFGLRNMRRRLRALLLPQPAPLATAAEARRAGLDEAALIACRDQRIVIVHIEGDGRHRIESSQARPGPASSA